MIYDFYVTKQHQMAKLVQHLLPIVFRLDTNLTQLAQRIFFFSLFSDCEFSCSFQFSCLLENLTGMVTLPVAGGSWPAAAVASWLCNE